MTSRLLSAGVTIVLWLLVAGAVICGQCRLRSENQRLKEELNWWRCERQYQLPAEPKEVE